MEMIQLLETLETKGLKEEHKLAESLLFALKSYLKRKLFAGNENNLLENKIGIPEQNNLDDIRTIEEEGEIINIKIQNKSEDPEEALSVLKKEETNKTPNKDKTHQECNIKLEKDETGKLAKTEPANFKGCAENVELTDAFIENIEVVTKSEYKEEKEQRVARIMRLVSKSGAVVAKCEHCSFSLEGKAKVGKYTRGKMRKHKRDCHFVCEVCRNKCESRDELKDHMKSVHTIRGGVSLCAVNGCTTLATNSAASTGLSKLILHVEVVHDKIRFICKICNKPYRKWSEHKLLHEIDPSELRTCTLCNLDFTSEKLFRIHNTHVHPKPQEEQTNKKGNLMCEKCSYGTWKPINFMIHKAKHTIDGEIKCEKCPFSTKQRFSFREHLGKEHSIGEVFKCSICSYTTTAINKFNNHVSRHTKENQMMCDQCEYRTSVAIDLKRHMRKAHSDNPKYICDQCEYKTSDSSNFIAHKRSIHGSEVHQCEFCEYSTRSIRSFRGHRAKWHSAEQTQS